MAAAFTKAAALKFFFTPTTKIYFRSSIRTTWRDTHHIVGIHTASAMPVRTVLPSKNDALGMAVAPRKQKHAHNNNCTSCDVERMSRRLRPRKSPISQISTNATTINLNITKTR